MGSRDMNLMFSYSKVLFREKRMQSLILQKKLLATHVLSTLNIWKSLRQNVKMRLFYKTECI